MGDRLVVAVLTTGRQDLGILRSTILALQAAEDLDLRLLVGGMHLKARFGSTIQQVRALGAPIAAELEFVAEPPDPPGDTARAVQAVASALQGEPPAALLLVGDRHETAAAALAAALCQVPVVHLHGGEETEGAIDNALRHAITKLSHLHLVTHELYARRVVQMGEAPERVRVVGTAALDNLLRPDLPDRDQLEARLKLRLTAPVVLVTVHPTTLGGCDPLEEAKAVAHALESCPGTIVITQPNADAGGAAIRAFWETWRQERERVALVDALGERYYWGLLRLGDAVVGNSSSGLLEAPHAGVPTINVGDRQKGRIRAATVRDTPAVGAAVADALAEALSDGRPEPEWAPPTPVSERILDALRQWLPERTLRKPFRLVEKENPGTKAMRR